MKKPAIPASLATLLLVLCGCQPDVPELPPEWPAGLPAPVLSGVVPDSVYGLEDAASDTAARPSFDYFSWQSFIALNWPVDSGSRGVPDSPDDPSVFTAAGATTATVWGSYKGAWELLNQDEQRPSPWDSSTIAVTPCGQSTTEEKLMLMASKSGTMLDDLNEAFSYPLIDQDSNYVYFEISFNEQQYDFVRGIDNDSTSWLYRAVNLQAAEPISMPATSSAGRGAIMLKAGWRILDGSVQVDTSRFHRSRAQVYNPVDSTCTTQTLGLVALHIAQKMEAFPQWIWSTFEHVDNVPGSASTGPYSFNNGTDAPATPRGWANRPERRSPQLRPKAQRTPAQVTGLNPIPDTPAGASTRDLNRIYQGLLAGTVWENYELVATQWPTDPANFVLPGDGGIYAAGNAGAPFPTAVGDAAVCYDPLSAHGLTLALASGRDAAAAVAAHLAGDCDALPAYADRLHQAYLHYAGMRSEYYTNQMRWPEAPFWSRRGGKGRARQAPARPPRQLLSPHRARCESSL